MNEQECIHTYNILHEILVHAGLGWISIQVAEQVRSGRITQKEAETLREEKKDRGESQPTLFPVGLNITQFKKGSKDTFPVTVEYRPPERLLLLLDAIEHSVADIAQMEDQLVQFFNEEAITWDRIVFYDENSSAEPILLAKEQVPSHVESSRLLKQLIDNLRGLV